MSVKAFIKGEEKKRKNLEAAAAPPVAAPEAVAEPEAPPQEGAGDLSVKSPIEAINGEAATDDVAAAGGDNAMTEAEVRMLMLSVSYANLMSYIGAS